jgi:hypothetical protein
MALVATAGLNGTNSNSTAYLYIASAESSGTNDHKIRIDQISMFDIRLHTHHIDETYPSYKTTREIGMKAMPAAIPPKTGIRNYLYLSWLDKYSDNIYKSVVQKYDDAADDDEGSTWITKSDKTLFLGSYRGVRLLKTGSESEDITVFGYVDKEYDVSKAILYGRY